MQGKTKKKTLNDNAFEILFETIALGVVYQDGAGEIIAANPAAERILGLTEAQMQGKRSVDPSWRSIHADGSDFPGETHPAMVALETGEVQRNVIMGVYNPARGDHTWITIDAFPQIRNGDDRPHLVFTTFADITESIHAREAVQRGDDKYRTLFEAAGDAIFIAEMGPQGPAIVDCNASILAMFGGRREDILGKSPVALSPPVQPDGRSSAEAIAENAKRAMAGIPQFVEWTHCRLDGTPFDSEVTISRVHIGDTLCMQAIVRDITLRKRAERERRLLEEKIRETQKTESLQRLAGGVAHDFNNLLHGILGNASLALMDLPADSPLRAQVENIESTSQHAAELAKQMLAYSGKGAFHVEVASLSSMIREMQHIMTASISMKAELRLDLHSGLPGAAIDINQMRQVVMNLVNNASESLEHEEGTITVSTGTMVCDRAVLDEAPWSDHLPEGPYVYVEVADTGSGMSPEILGRIFDPFFSTKFTGRGLGLASVSGILRGLKGTVQVKSTPGKGTRFRVLLPAREKTAPNAQEWVASAASWTGGGTVLLVDDDQLILQVGEQMLTRAGFTVLTARDGVEAVDTFEKNAREITLVLLDLKMPRMDGKEAFVEIRRIDPSATVVLSSGFTEDEATHELEGGNLAGFIQKPYRYSQLMESLRRALS